MIRMESAEVPQHEGRNLQRVRVAWRSEEYECEKGEFQKSECDLMRGTRLKDAG
jgi:hypothetical protein